MKITPRLIGILSGSGVSVSLFGMWLAWHGAGGPGAMISVFGAALAITSAALARRLMRQLGKGMSPEARALLDEYMKEIRYREKDRKGVTVNNRLQFQSMVCPICHKPACESAPEVNATTLCKNCGLLLVMDPSGSLRRLTQDEVDSWNEVM